MSTVLDRPLSTPSVPAASKSTWHRWAVASIALVTAAVPWLLGTVKTAFSDEGLYLFMGHRMIEHARTGEVLFEFPGSYFSGAPALYPVLGALADSVGGLMAARVLSGLFIAVAVICVYGLGSQLFGRNAGLFAAGAFATSGSVLYLGHFATFDAPMLALLAGAAWLTAYSAKRDGLLWGAVIGLIMALAALTKYAGLAYVPVIMALGVAVGAQRFGWKLMIKRSIFIGTSTAGFLFFGVMLWGQSLFEGIVKTTLERNVINEATPAMMLPDIAVWAGPWLVLAAIGGVLLVRTQRSQWALVLVLLGASVLAIVQQLRIGESTSLSKHVAFGIVFAAPLIGWLLAKAFVRHTALKPLVIAVLAGLGALGTVNAHAFLTNWVPNDGISAAISSQLGKVGDAAILGDQPSAERYSLQNEVKPQQWRDTYSFYYDGLSGIDAMKLAVDRGDLGLIYSSGTTPDGRALQDYLVNGQSKYQLTAKVPRYFKGKHVGDWLVYMPTTPAPSVFK